MSMRSAITALIERSEIWVLRPPMRHDPLAHAARTVISPRPAQGARMSPMPSSHQPALFAERAASLSCAAIDPVAPEASTRRSRPSVPATVAIKPTTTSIAGTRNRNRRSAIALPNIDANASRSRSYSWTLKLIVGDDSLRARNCSPTRSARSRPQARKRAIGSCCGGCSSAGGIRRDLHLHPEPST